jgi:hypothetical protein
MITEHLTDSIKATAKKILRHNNGVSAFFKTGGRQPDLSPFLQNAMAQHTAPNVMQV